MNCVTKTCMTLFCFYVRNHLNELRNIAQNNFYCKLDVFFERKTFCNFIPKNFLYKTDKVI